MHHAHQSLNDRVLKSLRIIVIREGKDCMTADHDKIHKFLCFIGAKSTNLQTQLPNTHENVQL